MAIRTILVPLSGGAATAGAIETACRLAQRFGAHLQALHVRPDRRDTLPMLGADISASVTADLIAMAQRESEANAAKAKAAFDAAIAHHALPERQKPLAAGQAAACGCASRARQALTEGGSRPRARRDPPDRGAPCPAFVPPSSTMLGIL